jgi:hypothetical protein
MGHMKEGNDASETPDEKFVICCNFLQIHSGINPSAAGSESKARQTAPLPGRAALAVGLAAPCVEASKLMGTCSFALQEGGW